MSSFGALPGAERATRADFDPSATLKTPDDHRSRVPRRGFSALGALFQATFGAIAMKIRMLMIVVLTMAVSMLPGVGKTSMGQAKDWPPTDFSPPKLDWSSIGKPVTYAVPPGLTTPESLRFDKPFQQGPRCGVNGLFAMLQICGKDVTYDDVQRRVKLGPDGANLEDLRESASAFGLRAEVRKLTPEDIVVAPKPIMVHVNAPATGSGKAIEGGGHFTVITSVDAEGVFNGIDTTNGLFTSWSPDRISRDTTGYCLVLDAGPRSWLFSLKGSLIAGHFALIIALNFLIMARIQRRNSHAQTTVLAG